MGASRSSSSRRGHHLGWIMQSGVVPPFALSIGSFVGAGRDSVASLKALVTQIVGLDQVVLSFEAPVSVGIAPGQAVSCAGASRTAAKFCGGRDSVCSLLVVLAGRRMRDWLDVVKLLSGARDANQLVAQKVYHNLGGGGLFEFGSFPLPGSFQISPKLEEHDGCLHLVQSVTFTLFHGGFDAIEARLEAVEVFPVEPQVTTCFDKFLHRTLINKPLVFIRGIEGFH